jgi:uncharacterized membrane protein
MFTTLGRRTRRVALAVVAAVVLPLAVPDAASAQEDPAQPLAVAGFVREANGRYRTIEAPRAATETWVFGNNNRGQIVGFYNDEDGRNHGFVRDRRGRFRTIDMPGAYATAATRINDRGQIAGDYFPTRERFEQGLKRGFVYDRGRFVRIDVPGSDSTEAVGLDDRGRVVGETFTIEPFSGRGFLWDDGRIRFIDVPGAYVTGAEEINERRQVAGTYVPDASGTTTRGYLLDRGRFRTFAAPGGPLTQVFGLNNRGQIVGYTADDPALNNAHGFVLPQGVGGPVRQIDVPGAPRTIALGINDGGQIVGAFERPGAAGAADRDDRDADLDVETQALPMMPGRMR